MTTQVKKRKSSLCEQCSGLHYLLTNKKGSLKAKPCRCFHCKICDGSGRVFTEDNIGRSSVNSCECMEFHKRLRMLSACGIPSKFKEATFDSFKTSAKNSERSKNYAKTVAMDFVKNFGNDDRGLVLSGEPGLGKTHLAAAIIKKLIMEKGADCKFVDFFQLLSDIRHGYSQDVSELSHILPYLQSRVLVIDELAKGRNSDWEHAILDQVISYRYNTNDKTTIYTSNYNDRENETKKIDSKIVDTRKEDFSARFANETLESRVGPRIFSRMIETCDFLHLEGDDFRQTHKTLHHL